MPNRVDGGSALAGPWTRTLGGRLRLAISVIAIFALAASGYYVARYAEMLILLSSVVGEHNFIEDSVKNRRGDKVKIRTDTSGRSQDSDRTVVWLRRADHWFSTTLVQVDSFGVEEKLQWLNDNNLDVSLGFGCLVHTTHAVAQVGPIHIAYHFSDGNKELAKGCPD